MLKHPSMTLLFYREIPLKLQTTYNAKTCRKINCVIKNLSTAMDLLQLTINCREKNLYVHTKEVQERYVPLASILEM